MSLFKELMPTTLCAEGVLEQIDPIPPDAPSL
jgi:hypothetical protein